MAATFERLSVTTALARTMIEAAERKAAEMGQPFVIAIVDDSGVLKAFSRMDGAPLLSVQVARKNERKKMKKKYNRKIKKRNLK